MARTPADTVQLKLRFREDLRSRLEEAASRNEASLNSEIVRRLEDSFTLENELGGPEGLALHRHIAWAIKQAEAREGAKWTETSDAFNAAVGAVEAAMEDLQPHYEGATGENIKRLYIHMTQAQRAYEVSYDRMKERFPIQTTMNALASLDPNYVFVSGIIANYRYDHIMSDDELDEVVADLSEADKLLVREHQETIRSLKQAELAWRFEVSALISSENAARDRAKVAVRQARHLYDKRFNQR